MINRENLIKIGRAGGNTSNRETPDQIGRVGMSACVVLAQHSVLFYFTFYVMSSYSISLIRDPARGTTQLYLRVAWTYAFQRTVFP